MSRRATELRETLQLRLSGEFKRFADKELRAVLALLAGPGVVWELAFGSWVLLQPERINAYAQAVIRTLQADEHQRGCLMEERVLKGGLTYESSMPRLAGDEERFVLLVMHQTLVERGLCLRQPTGKGNLLVFFCSSPATPIGVSGSATARKSSRSRTSATLLTGWILHFHCCW